MYVKNGFGKGLLTENTAGENGGGSKWEITNGRTPSNYDDITATAVTFVSLCCTLFLLEVKHIALHGPTAINRYK